MRNDWIEKPYDPADKMEDLIATLPVSAQEIIYAYLEREYMVAYTMILEERVRADHLQDQIDLMQDNLR
jgi:hypothetical protein